MPWDAVEWPRVRASGLSSFRPIRVFTSSAIYSSTATYISPPKTHQPSRPLPASASGWGLLRLGSRMARAVATVSRNRQTNPQPSGESSWNFKLYPEARGRSRHVVGYRGMSWDIVGCRGMSCVPMGTPLGFTVRPISFFGGISHGTSHGGKSRDFPWDTKWGPLGTREVPQEHAGIRRISPIREVLQEHTGFHLASPGIPRDITGSYENSREIPWDTAVGYHGMPWEPAGARISPPDLMGTPTESHNKIQ